MGCTVTAGGCDLWDLPACCPPLFYGYLGVPPEPGEPDATVGHGPDCFVGMAGKSRSGLGNVEFQIGCGTGCLSCDDRPPSMRAYDDKPFGGRWLRVDVDSQYRRDARGIMHDLRANEFHQIVQQVDYLRAKGWTNDERECFGHGICSYWGVNRPRLYYKPGTGACDGVPIGEELRGVFRDEFFYHGWSWPYSPADPSAIGNQQMHCRKFGDNLFYGEPTPIAADQRVLAYPQRRNGLPMPVLLRAATSNAEPAGSVKVGGAGACNINYLVPCTMPVSHVGDTCLNSFWNGWDNPELPLPTHYEETERSAFSSVRVLDNTAHLADDATTLTPDLAAALDVRNKVLAFAKAHSFSNPSVRFDQIDALGETQPGNYRRAWDGRGNSLGQRPEVVGVFGTCRMRHSGVPIRCRLRINEVLYTAMLIPHRVAYDDALGTAPECEPHVTVSISIGCSVEASVIQVDPGNPVPFQHVSPTTGVVTPLAIVNPPDDPQGVSGLPRISHELQQLDPNTPDLDEIEYLDAKGRWFRPPLLTEWFGFLGGYTLPSVKDDGRFFVSAVSNPCRDFYEAWNNNNGSKGVRVPGWRSVMESNDGVVDSVYDGRLFLKFKGAG